MENHERVYQAMTRREGHPHRMKLKVHHWSDIAHSRSVERESTRISNFLNQQPTCAETFPQTSSTYPVAKATNRSYAPLKTSESPPCA